MRLIDIFFIITALFSLHTIRVSLRKFGFIHNHYAIYNAWWLFCLFIAMYYNNFDRPVGDDIFCIFFIGLFAFNSTLYTSKIRSINFANVHNVNSFYSLKKRRILEIMVIVAMVPLAYKNLMAILSGEELWKLYMNYWEEERGTGSYLKQLYEQNIVAPLSSLLMATCLFNNYADKKKYSGYVTFLIGGILALLGMLMSAGGRSGIMIFIFIVILSYLSSRLPFFTSHFIKINGRYITGVVVLCFVGIGWASFNRGGSEVLLEVLTERAALFAALFEGYYRDNDMCNGYYLGLSMFETPLALVSYPFKSLGLEFDRMSSMINEPHYTPADGRMHNAAVSAFLFYMRDFGKLGVVIGPIITAKLYNLLYKISCRNNFLLVFYLTAVCATCFATDYPFGRGFIFLVLFAFLYSKYLKA